jgi:nitronate monooxygenase
MVETMWPDRRLIDLFGIEHPIVLSPMATIGTIGLAASVCTAGGLGSIACAGLPPEAVANMVRELRTLTARPFSVNFFCHSPAKADSASEQAWRDRLSVYHRELGLECDMPLPHRDIAPFNAAMCDVIEDVRPSVISFHFGLPDAALLTRVKAAGCRVMSSATTVEEARWLEARGVDAVIAQGCEAGGHRATFLAADIDQAMASQSGTFALVPQVVDAVSVPVIAAGGIADGRGIAAAFALGAAGVQLGTAYLLCPEAATPSLHRDALRKGVRDATVLSNVFTGRPARLLVNRLVREIGPMAAATPAFPLAMGGIAPLRAAAESRGNTDFTPFWAGQASPLGREIPAEPLTASLVKEAGERFRQLCG